MTQIRPCTLEDIPAVAALFQRTFRDPRRSAPASLQVYLQQLFLEHPWYDPELASKVYVAADGTVGGFIGILPLHLAFRGASIRAAVAGSLMVERPEENPLAGARLLRAFITGPQDVSLSDSANPVSLAMWERLGGKSVPAESMEWLRVFHPAATTLALAAEATPLTRLARPLAFLVDRIAGRIKRSPLRLDPATTAPARDAQASDDELIRLIPEFAATYAVRPAWEPATLRWVLANAAHKRRHGTTFRRVVHGKDGQPLGCYIYYGRPGGIGWVLQVLARPDGIEPVVDNLFVHAHGQGCVAVRGRTQSRLLEALQRRHCLFFHRSATVIHGADAALLAAIRAGDALVVGLSGDAWTRLIGDTFS